MYFLFLQKQSAPSIKAHHTFFSMFFDALASLGHTLFTLQMRLRKKLVGKADNLFLQSKRNHFAVGNRKTLFLYALQGYARSGMPFANQRMAGETFPPHQFRAQIAVAYIRMSAETEYIFRIGKEYADIVQHSSLFDKLQVQFQFRMATRHRQCLIGNGTAVGYQDTLQLIVLWIIFVYQSKRIHGYSFFIVRFARCTSRPKPFLCMQIYKLYRTKMKNRIILFFYSLFLALHASAIRTGAERMEILLPLIENKRVSLVINQTSRCGNAHLLDTLYNIGIEITQVFAPEHGFRGEADAGATVRDGKDSRTGIPIVSLYGKNKKPQPAQLAGTDIVIFDIQDVGARFYTYISTLYYVMQACAEQGKTVIVLDRPNPCDYVDGPMLRPEYKSFVGMLPIPVLHGCTVGELAQMINGEGWLGKELTCPLQVIAAKGWRHGQPYPLPVKPSPNLPNDQAIALYASLCPFEGTSVSVGRGTEHPFQVIGSPVIKDSFRFMPRPLKGSDMNPLHKSRYCYGKDLRRAVPPKGFSLKYVLELYRCYRTSVPNPEKEFFTRPRWFDLLMGTNQVRQDILKGKTEEEIRAAWQKDLADYKAIRQKYLLY